MPKRKTPPPPTSTREGGEERPDPPPPPPASLVKLLQKDSKVLKYFQALQENLDFDVRKWKTRARKFEADYQKLLVSSKEEEHQPPKNSQQQQRRQEEEKEEENEQPALNRRQAVDVEAKKLVVSTSPANGNGTKHDADDDDGDDDKGSTANEELPVADSNSPEHRGVPIDDSMFNFSSDDDDDDDDNSDSNQQETSPLKGAPKPPPPSRQPSWKIEQQRTAWEKLQLASSYLETLGVSLVVEETPDGDKEAADAAKQSDNANNDMGSDDDSGTGLLQQAAHDSRIKIIRRTDAEVATDLLRTIKALVRIKYENVKGKHVLDDEENEKDLCHHNHYYYYYYPFMTRDMIPCYNALPQRPEIDPPHPAVEGFRLVLTCLCWIDVYCPHLPAQPPSSLNDSLTSSEPSHRLGGHANGGKLFIGMRGRHLMVDRLLKSLEGEICEAWGVQDRTTRLQTVSIHFSSSNAHNDNDMEEAHDTSQEQGTDADKSSSEGGTIKKKSLSSSSGGEGSIPFGAKNHVRLSALVERCFLARLVATIYLFRQDPRQATGFAWTYLLSTAPALLLEDHPKLPPVQSLCVLEAILSANTSAIQENQIHNDHNAPELYEWFSLNPKLSSQWFTMALGQVVATTACIQRIRLSSCDDRISDVAKVELAAFDRFFVPMLVRTKHNSLTAGPIKSLSSSDSLQDRSKSLAKFTADILSAVDNRPTHELSSITKALLLLLTLGGNKEQIAALFEKSLSHLLSPTASSSGSNENATSSYENALCKALACAEATAQLEVRSLDAYREICQSTITDSMDTLALNKTGRSTAHSLFARSVTSLTSSPTHVFEKGYVISGMLLCCKKLADGESLSNLLHYASVESLKYSSMDMKDSLDFMLGDAIHQSCQTTRVRVINLERRKDRMAAFMAQAMQEHLLVQKAVVDLKDQSTASDARPNPRLCGRFAIDGEGRPAEVEEYLAAVVGGQTRLNELVHTHWRPNDLKPFDTEAPDSEDVLVRISPSEKACALSHIASWYGVIESLRTVLGSPRGSCPTDFGGFASGPALFPENEDMEPSPVCIILEDDAVLVDRFTDRLKSLLDELPRDFHFCSLGYSRPKTAPLLPFTPQVGIPTAIWYLTGYVLSLEGAQYLSDHLPIRGPVDSWVGLTMFANWNNALGHAMGVGYNSKSSSNNGDGMIPRKDLRQALRFRAFAATVPLCSQKVGLSSAQAAKSRSWRQRDTDITFSGN